MLVLDKKRESALDHWRSYWLRKESSIFSFRKTNCHGVLSGMIHWMKLFSLDGIAKDPYLCLTVS
jgi:hypothetical protein